MYYSILSRDSYILFYLLQGFMLSTFVKGDANGIWISRPTLFSHKASHGWWVIFFSLSKHSMMAYNYVRRYQHLFNGLGYIPRKCPIQPCVMHQIQQNGMIEVDPLILVPKVPFTLLPLMNTKNINYLKELTRWCRMSYVEYF